MRLWSTHNSRDWVNNSRRYQSSAERAIALGQFTIANDILSEGLTVFPKHSQMRYLAALALAKSGSDGSALRAVRRLLSDLSAHDPVYTGAISLAGRIAKDRWSRLAEGPEKIEAGEQARSAYLSAFKASHDYFPGINAATLCILTGHHREGKRIAGAVKTLCETALNTRRSDKTWIFATLGEASLLLGDPGIALEWYGKARASAGLKHGDIASMRRQVKLLQPRLNLSSEFLDVLAIPRVAVFTGHMIDAPGRSEPRFPRQMESAVATWIATTLENNKIGFGYSSAACGADILFIEQMQRKSTEANVVLPFRRSDFIQTSVAFAGNGWVKRFDQGLHKAASVTYCVDESYLGDDILFAHASNLTKGLAVLRADQLETELVNIAVLDPIAKGRTGGAFHTAKSWSASRGRMVILDLRKMRAQQVIRQVGTSVVRTPRKSTTRRPASVDSRLPWGKREIKTMVFADIVGFSKLREEESPAFFTEFLPLVQRVLAACKIKPAFGNTWGDGLYIVFDDVLDAAEFSLQLRDAVSSTNWASVGLPNDISIRIGAHTGPVFRIFDPVIKQVNFFGSHVIRAARIEPVATPGSVYITEQMAATLTVDDIGHFTSDYLGQLSLAKQYGATKLYRLRRASEPE